MPSSERSEWLVDWPGPGDAAHARVVSALSRGQGHATVPAVETNPPHIGPYLVLAPVARGVMGEVWRAPHPSLERDVAVKVIRADLHDKPAMR